MPPMLRMLPPLIAAQPPARLAALDSFAGSLGQRVYLSLKQAIMSLAYRPGEFIRKAEVCDTLGVSRSPVADAVARLAVEGLVRVLPQAGTYVARFSMTEIREGAFMREAIELQAVDLVAGTATAADIARLRECLARQAELISAGRIPEFHAEDAQMHQAILSMTGFPRLSQVSETAWLQVNRARQLILPVPGRVQATLEEHRRIIDAIAANDPDAARAAVRAHLRQLIRYLEPLERERPELFDPV
jgi:GntR family transcriptional regulator, rspAB operon transcriptional repressor